jgi:hypothetical protein
MRSWPHRRGGSSLHAHTRTTHCSIDPDGPPAGAQRAFLVQEGLQATKPTSAVPPPEWVFVGREIHYALKKGLDGSTPECRSARRQWNILAPPVISDPAIFRAGPQASPAPPYALIRRNLDGPPRSHPETRARISTVRPPARCNACPPVTSRDTGRARRSALLRRAVLALGEPMRKSKAPTSIAGFLRLWRPKPQLRADGRPKRMEGGRGAVGGLEPRAGPVVLHKATTPKDNGTRSGGD